MVTDPEARNYALLFLVGKEFDIYIYFFFFWGGEEFGFKNAIVAKYGMPIHGTDFFEPISDYTPRFNEVERGVYWYHLVRLSVCGQNRVRSVSSTILVGFISYLHILSSNFRRCVVCNARFKILKIWNFGEFFKFVIWLCLLLTCCFWSVSSAATAVYSSGWILSIFGTNDQ